MNTGRPHAAATAAASAPIAPTQWLDQTAAGSIVPPSFRINATTQASADNGLGTTYVPLGSLPQTSPPFVSPSRPSTRRYTTPKNVRAFASQVNDVASRVLNGEMELEAARVYSGLARTVAQAMSTEVSRARFLSQAPDLTFEKEDE